MVFRLNRVLKLSFFNFKKQESLVTFFHNTSFKPKWRQFLHEWSFFSPLQNPYFYPISLFDLARINNKHLIIRTKYHQTNFLSTSTRWARPFNPVFKFLFENFSSRNGALNTFLIKEIHKSSHSRCSQFQFSLIHRLKHISLRMVIYKILLGIRQQAD